MHLVYALLGITIFLGITSGFLLVLMQRERSSLRKRIRELVVLEDEDRPDRTEVAEKVVRKVSFLAGVIRTHLGGRTDASVEERLTAAGIQLPRAADVYFVTRIASPTVFALVTYFVSQHNFFFALGAAALGYILPDFFLDRLVKRYRLKIRRAMPDMVDLLSVCVEAGLGIDQAMLRTAREMSIAYPELCYELLMTNKERQAGLTRAAAWENLVQRTQSDDLDTLVTILGQADQLGTPITTALRNYADDLRIQRQNLAKEKAKKAAVLILIPLVLFIFPTVFIIMMGPAVLTLADGLSRGFLSR
jgi:tight adherence protein C